MGSYGRGTCIYTSDIDMVFQLPKSVYEKYDAYYSNGQSALLRSVKNYLKIIYPQTKLRVDGQVVVVEFSDGVKFEIVPAFMSNTYGTYTYPDSNGGGTWRTMNPRAELEAFRNLDNECNGNLRRLCRMTRSWNEAHDVVMSGILIYIIGSIACGIPILAEENVEDYIPVLKGELGKGEFFALRAHSDSMIGAGINDGELVFVRKQETV